MKQRRFRQIAFVIITIIMLFAVAVSVSAAKENYMNSCGYIGIRGCAIPEAGQKPDFDVEENWPSQYSIKSINWYRDSVSASNAVGGTETFRGNTVYIVEFEVWANSGYCFTTDSNGYTTVVADISPNYAEYGEFDAQVLNVYGKDNSKYLTVRYTFPATGSTATKIGSLSITDVVEPRAGETFYNSGTVNHNQMLVTNIYWYRGSQKMSSKDTFIEGETYTVYFHLQARDGYEFATDTTSLPAPTGHRWPAVSATINGESATVMFDTAYNSTEEHIIVITSFVCAPSRLISSVEITGVTEPKTGEEPKRYVALGSDKYQRVNLSNYAYAGGVGWLDGKGNLMRINQDIFAPSTAYTIEIKLEATGEYKFALDEYNRPLVSATVNGNAADVSYSDGILTVTYKFKKTSSLELSKVEVSDIEAPVDGALPDFTMSLGDTTYGPYYSSNNEITMNSISWLDTTTNQYMRVGVDKFVGGHDYSVIVILGAKGDYTFKYIPETDSYTVSAKINGKAAQIEECDEDSVVIYYDYSCAKVEHKCTLTMIPEVKATCTIAGKKAYYHCAECGVYYENDKATKPIDNVATWGVIEALGHSGGKATCTKQAQCKNCGSYYGNLAAHDYGTKWDYINETGHAHACKNCGAHDTVVPHSGGESKCDERAKCSECKAEYGEAAGHKYVAGYDYTDAKGHARTCVECGKRTETVAHSGGVADCQNKAKCSSCGTEYGKVGEHSWSSEWTYSDKKGHAHTCTVEGCSEHSEVEKHTPGAEATETSPQTCTVCGYVIKAAKGHKHDLTKVKEKDATCTTAGTKQYYTCSGCDSIFSDSKGENEIEDKNSIIIPATGHSETKWKTNASSHWQICAAKGCGIELSDKAEHEFGEDNKCIVCGYNKKTGKVETEEPATDAPVEDGPETDDPKTDKPKDSEETNAPVDKHDDITPDNANNKTLWIVIGAVLFCGVVCIIVVTVVLIENSKKK